MITISWKQDIRSNNARGDVAQRQSVDCNRGYRICQWSMGKDVGTLAAVMPTLMIPFTHRFHALPRFYNELPQRHQPHFRGRGQAQPPNWHLVRSASIAIFARNTMLRRRNEQAPPAIVATRT